MVKRPTRKPEPSSFTMQGLINLGAIPIVTALLTGIGFYFSTNATLTKHTEDINHLTSIVTQKTDEDTKARDKIRDQFLQSQVKTTEGIAKLDTRLAVAETQQNVANAQLTKISETLEKISNYALTGKR